MKCTSKQKQAYTTLTETSVHGLAHDAGEEGAAAADERAHHGEQRLVQDEALRAQGPACEFRL